MTLGGEQDHLIRGAEQFSTNDFVLTYDFIFDIDKFFRLNGFVVQLFFNCEREGIILQRI